MATNKLIDLSRLSRFWDKVKAIIGDLSDLTTTDKSSIVGAINEIASYTPVYNNTASGAIATFDTSLALPLQNLQIAINAVQESGTPTPSSPKAISGFTGANIAVYNENLFTSMATFSNDGITTSYDNTTGYISIRNDSRTTNYVTGSTREHVATGLNSSHTYKYAIFPNVTGVVIANGSDVLSKDGFTGYTTVSLRITKDYDFVNDYPIGSVTKVRLVLYDVTTGVLNTYPITWQSEAGTVYGGSLDVTTGLLTVDKASDTINNLTMNYHSTGSVNYLYGSIANKYSTAIDDTEHPLMFEMLEYGGSKYASQFTDMACYQTNGLNFYIVDNSCSSKSDFITKYGTARLVWYLATPVTYQLTPTQINTIVGTNNVFTDTNGNTSVVYACSLKDYIDGQ